MLADRLQHATVAVLVAGCLTVLEQLAGSVALVQRVAGVAALTQRVAVADDLPDDLPAAVQTAVAVAGCCGEPLATSNHTVKALNHAH